MAGIGIQENILKNPHVSSLLAAKNPITSLEVTFRETGIRLIAVLNLPPIPMNGPTNILEKEPPVSIKELEFNWLQKKGQDLTRKKPPTLAITMLNPKIKKKYPIS